MNKYKETIENLLKVAKDRVEFTEKLASVLNESSDSKICIENQGWYHSLAGEQLLIQQEIEEFDEKNYTDWVLDNSEWIVEKFGEIKENNDQISFSEELILNGFKRK